MRDKADGSVNGLVIDVINTLRFYLLYKLNMTGL